MIRLKELREEFALTQTQLAKELNVTQNTISKWETNFNEPNIATLIILANFFHVTVDYLIAKDDTVITNEKEIETVTAEERELLKEIRSLTSAQQSRVLGYIEGLKNKSAKRSIDNE